MKIVNLIQGTPEWHAHRAAHWNASDAPAMLGVSPYKTRAQLLREYATGIAQEVDAATQRRFDDGHRYEALCRPMAQEIIGEELYPCVGVDGRYSASFDGLTMLYDTAFEHKSLNDILRAAFNAIEAAGGDGSMLPDLYRVQMEQQCMVSGAERVLFVASRWEGETCTEHRHCWYKPDPALRARIVAGWEQFELDVAEYKPAEAAPVLTARAPETLPALRIEVTGMVTASNLAEFKERAIAVFQSINTDLQTDQDFIDAEQTVKWCGDIEDRLKAAKDAALAQTESIDALFRAIDSISAEARAKRLELDKLVKTRKEAVRAEIVDRARKSVVDHVYRINETLGEHAIGITASLQAEIGSAIKGKRTIASITEAAETAAAGAKIAYSQQAERVRTCVAVLAKHAAGFEQLFADRVALCATKAPEDLRNLVAARIAEHQQRESARIEAERERIRQEEAARIERERAAEELAKAKQSSEGAELSPAAQALHEQEGAQRFAEHHPAAARVTKADSGSRIKLGDINARIAPLSITADGLASLGFQPVGTERSAKLYAESDFVPICRALYRVIQAAATAVEA